jgi:hypothetical protein
MIFGFYTVTKIKVLNPEGKKTYHESCYCHFKQTCEDISAVDERTAAERLTAPRGGETRLPGHGTGFCCTVLPGWADDSAR